MGEIWLVGVVHRDPRGLSRLSALLRRLAPQAVGLELSSPSVQARRERGAMLRARLSAGLRQVGRAGVADDLEAGRPLQGVAAELALAIEVPYELLAAEEWAAASGAVVELLDDPVAAAQAVAVLEGELLSAQNLEALLDEEARAVRLADPVAEQYALARRYFADPQLFRYHFGAEELAVLEARDGFVAEGLRALARRFAKVVYVAGWEHLVDAGLATLWTLFKQEAQRLLLADALAQDEGRS